MQVLLVEDSAFSARHAELSLRKAGGASIATVTKGTLTEAIAELKAGGIDCILLDLGLPDAEGKRYRLRERGGGQVPTAQASRLRPSA